jgi:cytidine deaminase
MWWGGSRRDRQTVQAVDSEYAPAIQHDCRNPLPFQGFGEAELFVRPRRTAGMDEDHDPDDLVDEARGALENAYVPYSEYEVGAALLADEGTVYTGANVENANYSNSLHAEEVALSRAWMAGAREFVALAVSSGVRDGVTPCGMCRQTLVELCPAEMPVYCDEGDSVTEYTLGELIPATISRETLGK